MFLPKEEQNLYEKIKTGDFDKNEGHPTASAFVISKSGDKILMIYHRKYDSWGWIGGHTEKNETALQAAIRELTEETGLSARDPVSKTPIHVQKMWAFDHYHFNTTFLFYADEDELLILNEQETLGVKWIVVDDMDRIVSEPHMLLIYHEILKRIKKSQPSL